MSMEIEQSIRKPRIVFGGDRAIAVQALKFLIGEGVKPQGLMLAARERASHGDELRALCSDLPDELVWWGGGFRESGALRAMQGLELDYILSIHFPLIIPREVLKIPRVGVLNLHPAYLPYNRGWHTPSWAILDKTICGATLHFVEEGVDTGDIVCQRQVEPRPEDTANTLYQRLLEAEVQVFEEAWPLIASGAFARRPQPPGVGSAHKKKDLFQPEIQEIDLDAPVRGGDLIDRLRGLTTNRVEEAAYFTTGGARFRVQVKITRESV